jgi:very-short-patch-repair endonuclease
VGTGAEGNVVHPQRADVLRLAESQYGVIGRHQAIAAGMTGREVEYQVESGSWRETLYGVYRVAGAPRSDAMAQMAATLRVDGSALSQLTAAARLRLELRRPSGIDVAVCRTASGRATEIEVSREERARWNLVIHRPQHLDAIDLMTVDGIPCTTAARTLVDVAFQVDPESLETAFEVARRFGLVSTPFLERRVGALCGRGKPGSKAMYALLKAHAGDTRPAESRLEVRFARLLRRAGVILAERQFEVRLPNGEKARIDFAEPPVKLAVECEGYDFHGSRLRWKLDRRRTAWIESMGWRVLIVTWDDVTNAPEMTVNRVVDALAMARRAA